MIRRQFLSWLGFGNNTPTKGKVVESECKEPNWFWKDFESGPMRYMLYFDEREFDIFAPLWILPDGLTEDELEREKITVQEIILSFCEVIIKGKKAKGWAGYSYWSGEVWDYFISERFDKAIERKYGSA